MNSQILEHLYELMTVRHVNNYQVYLQFLPWAWLKELTKHLRSQNLLLEILILDKHLRGALILNAEQVWTDVKKTTAFFAQIFEKLFVQDIDLNAQLFLSWLYLWFKRFYKLDWVVLYPMIKNLVLQICVIRVGIDGAWLSEQEDIWRSSL